MWRKTKEERDKQEEKNEEKRGVPGQEGNCLPITQEDGAYNWQKRLAQKTPSIFSDPTSFYFSNARDAEKGQSFCDDEEQ